MLISAHDLSGQDMDYGLTHDSLEVKRIGIQDTQVINKVQRFLFDIDTNLISSNIHLFYADLGLSYYKRFQASKDTQFLLTAIDFFDKSLSHEPNNTKILEQNIECCFKVDNCAKGSYYFKRLSKLRPRKKLNNTRIEEVSRHCTKRNTIYAEIGGNIPLYSLNYERLFGIDKKIRSAMRSGFHYSDRSVSEGRILTAVGTTYSKLLPIDLKHGFFEIGLGLTFAKERFPGLQHTDHILYQTTSLGYRYQHRFGGIFLKAVFTPLLELYNHNPDPVQINYPKVRPLGGFGLGFTF